MRTRSSTTSERLCLSSLAMALTLLAVVARAQDTDLDAGTDADADVSEDVVECVWKDDASVPDCPPPTKAIMPDTVDRIEVQSVQMQGNLDEILRMLREGKKKLGPER